MGRSMDIYKPEGSLIDTPENREYLSSLASLEYAMNAGVVLEGRAALCDSSHALIVELGAYRGMIPREEAAYSIDGSEVRVIADLSDIAADSGSYTVPARVEVSGYDVGAVGAYEVTVHIG